MNQIRTTVSLDQDLHTQLSLKAVNLGISLSQLINKKLMNANFGKGKSAIKADLANDLAFLKRLSRKTGGVNWIKAVREERDRDSK